MVRIFFSILLIIITSSCGSFLCDYTGTQEGGLRSKNKYKSYIKKRINPAIVGIDTNVIYKDIHHKYTEGNEKFGPETDSLSLNTDVYHKFHANGTYYTFIKKGQNRILNAGSFNPDIGIIGFVLNRKDKYHFMSYSTINCGSFSKQEFEVKGDTLIVKHGSNKGFRTWYYYVKHKVPKEWLDFKSDI
ncbi:hypothetical protein AWE51_22250 [Aquimarina aggregata]|uniref:Lipoprotein n=1 Tax=Aquimarina aggregata TaxID=1642818 RepID=A0A163BI60_9FLAO|nr:hypothetical protein [Aquimarina aggregata]KZS41427.1 hypothetical protein AWE51_22250 [Aquimarina aggregata]